VSLLKLAPLFLTRGLKEKAKMVRTSTRVCKKHQNTKIVIQHPSPVRLALLTTSWDSWLGGSEGRPSCGNTSWNLRQERRTK
jgi:hypothetical protein